MTTFVGRTINNRYRLESLLGDGGMGSVYRGYDVNLERPVAVKLMHAHFARQSEFRARLVQEAQTAAKLDHPSVVKVFDFGEADVGLFIAMEYVDGGSVRDHLRRLQRMQKFLPLTQSLQIAIQIAEALHYAHQRGIIHRDVKPGNIILKRLSEQTDPPFQAILTDFGLVKLQEGTHMTESGTTLGTPTYMSPEQCEGEGLDGRSDIYSLGVVLYELVTNRLPFLFQSLSEALTTHSRGEMPLPPSHWRNDVPQLLDTILMKVLAKNPAERFATAGDVATALRSALVALEGAPTQVMTREEMDILEQVSEPPKGYELHINTPGHPVSKVPMTQPVFTVGRNVDNDIVLPTEGVSRHHARIQATLMGWEVIDLGGINGTWLNDHRLRIDEPTPVLPNGRIRIGPYELVLIGPEVVDTGTPSAAPVHIITGPTSPVVETGATLDPSPPEATPTPTPSKTTVPDNNPIALYLIREQVSVNPGEQVTFRVEVVNRSHTDDRVSLRIQGLPAHWITTPDEFVELPAGGQVQLGVQIQPPRQRSTPTGRQRFRVQVVSQQYPSLKVGSSASLLLGGFTAFETTLEPPRLRLPGVATVTIRNTGNAPATFSLVVHDRQNGLRIQGEKGRVVLESGQVAQVDLSLAAKRHNVFGSMELYPFDVEVVSSDGSRQLLSGESRTGAALPTFVWYILLFIVVFACAFATVSLISTNFSRFWGPSPTATTDVSGVVATQTAVAAAETVAAATAVTITPESLADDDQDGLSNRQEAELGTDPNNPDSDDDGLLDGVEFLEYGSDPNKADSDGDLLLDGVEVNVYQTNPIDPDTDGDGIRDAVEVDQGTDPLSGATNTPLPTATAIVAVTATDTPVVASSTPLIATATLTPESSATPTSEPSATATGVPSATFTATATEAATETVTPTATVTPTPTDTPMPNLQLSCTRSVPTIDGTYDPVEWGDAPFIEFGTATELVQVYMLRDSASIYLAFLINDGTVNASDTLRVFFDVTNNNGDPDTTDRFFLLARDETRDDWAGIGSNTDGQNWDDTYSSDTWGAAVGNSSNEQWVVEVQIIAGAEFPDLGDTFGFMTQVLLTEDMAIWPPDAISLDATTWQDVNNVNCE